ncbi:cupin domain-containing protein [Faunimonas sp. B44]|uniref:cupin domain-containing protein n=1 Tax=Faunimonas sp. B44 TaxID=3461493 RepID=UPI0040448CDE
MARVVTRAEAKRLGLPGRTALEFASADFGAQSVTMRIVEILPPEPGASDRGPHVHHGFEECIFVLSGEGTTFAESGEYPLRAGDMILIPPEESHMTRNTGSTPLTLLCFFPVADIRPGTEELPISTIEKARS